MKKINLWIASIACIVFFFGNYFKVQHWPGASILTTVGSVIGIVFLFMYLFGDIKNLAEGREKISGIIGSITLILVLVGFILKTQHWPGGTIMIYVGHGALLIFGIYLLIDAFGESDANKQIIKAFSAFTIFILMSILILLGLGSIMG